MLLSSLAFASLWLPTLAIYAANKSNCAAQCGGGKATSDTNIVCEDSLYTTTDKGKQMKSCLTCESTSTWFNHNSSQDNDIYWFLYNQKYTIQYCLWDNPSNTTAVPKCNQYCGSLNGALNRVWPTGSNPAGQYDYCGWDNGNLETYATDCASCLTSINGSVILGNFLNNLEANCESKPNATLGERANVTQQYLFASATTPSPSSTSEPSSASSGLSPGASAGIGVGVGVAVITAALLAWFFVRRGKRRSQQGQGEPQQGDQQQRDQEREDPSEKPTDNQPPQELYSNSTTVELPAAKPIYEAPAERQARDGQKTGEPPAELPGN